MKSRSGPSTSAAQVFCCAMLALWTQAEAALLTFEDIAFDEATEIVPIPDGYGGLNWSGARVVNPSAYNNGSTLDHYGPGVVSGRNVAINVRKMVISSDSAFLLRGAHFSSGIGGPMSITIEALLDGNGVRFDDVALNQGVVQYVPFNSARVDTLIFSVEIDTFTFTMDDLEIQPIAEIPEPTTLALIGLGVAGLVARRLRKQ